MICTCLGYRRVDFVNDQKQRFVGFNVFLSYPEANVTGLAADRIFFSDEFLRKSAIAFVVDKQYDVQFTRSGAVASVSGVE